MNLETPPDDDYVNDVLADFRQVLKRDRIYPHANFFEIVGNSLLVLRLRSRL